MYNPLRNKTPYGATAVGKDTEITFPLNPDLGVKRVFVVLRHVFGEGGAINKEEPLRVELPFAGNENGEDIFRGKLIVDSYGIWNYRFEGELEDGRIAFFGRDFDGTALRGDWLSEWQLTVSETEYKTPDWAKSGIIYHLFADRFCKAGDNAFNKHGRLHSDWYEMPDIQEDGKDYKADDYFGGDIKGIVSKLDYLKSLGVTCIYLSPVFEAFSNHRYDTGNYLKIDELFGTDEEFSYLIKQAEGKGINIMLDGVFNHTGADSIYFNREGRYNSLGAYQSKESPYYDWYTFTSYPDKYDCWWGSTVVPTVNKKAEGYKNLILGKDGVINKWTKLGVKGWRLDVVDELPVDFTTELCECIKNAGKDVLIVGEVWEDASVKIAYSQWRPYFMGHQLDSVMNYPFKEAILDYTCSGDAVQFISEISRILENYPKESLDTLMNLLGSHDTVRAITRLSGVKAPETKKERASFILNRDKYLEAAYNLKFASLLQYVLPGIPCIYYGDEAGVQGFEDPLNRSTYPWRKENTDILNHYIDLGRFRTEYHGYLRGETEIKKSGEETEIIRKTTKGDMHIILNPHGIKDIPEKEFVYSLDSRVRIYIENL